VPDRGLTGLSVSAVSSASTPTDWGLSAIALCGPGGTAVPIAAPPAAPAAAVPATTTTATSTAAVIAGPSLSVLMVEAGPYVYSAPRSETAGPCPSGRHVTGAGGAVTGDPSAYLSSIAIDLATKSATATGDFTTLCCFYVTIQVTAFAICG
jgi:hypothetical protein